MPQYGFFFDQSRCIACHDCAVACKSWNGISAGPVKWMRIHEWETGSFPNVQLHTLAFACAHCENPVCVDAANGAMYKEPKYGAVLIDPDKATSTSLRDAWNACPYGAILFDSDSSTATASKCTMCIDRLEQGLKPNCVMTCPMRALDFGTLDDMVTKYGSNRQLDGMPDPGTVKPAWIVKPLQAQKQVIPYDVNEALAMLAKREGYGKVLPPVFTSPSDVTDIPEGMVLRNKLNMKPNGTTELMRVTKVDDA